ncbi:MAG: EFR1 family ferrodoxin [Promethearchaeota archaeon]
MKPEIYYFTGTGNSLIVACDVAKKVDGILISIPSLTDKNTIISKAEMIGIVFPVYYAIFGGVPLIVEQFVKKMKNLDSKYIFAICTHAGGPGRTIIYLKKLLQNQGGELDAGFTVMMSVPYSPGVKIKRAIFNKKIRAQEEIVKDSEKQQELYKAWSEKLELILNHINNHNKGIFETTPSFTKIISSPLRSLSKITFRSRYRKLAKISTDKSKYSFEDFIRLADKSFEVNENCNGCVICAQICPVNNIKIIENRPKWQHHCENCYACYVWCPNDAIYGEIVAYNKKYHHPDVKVSDMIKNKNLFV